MYEVVYCLRFDNARNYLRESLELSFGSNRGIIDDSDCISGLEGIVPVSSQSSKSSSSKSQGSDTNSANLFKSPEKSNPDDFDSEDDDNLIAELNKTKTPVTPANKTVLDFTDTPTNMDKTGNKNVAKSSIISNKVRMSPKKLVDKCLETDSESESDKENSKPGPSTIADAVKARAKSRPNSKSSENDSSQSPDKEPQKMVRQPARKFVKKVRPKVKATKILKTYLNKIDESKADEYGWIKEGAGEFTTPKLIKKSKRRRSTIGSPEASLTTKCKKDNYLF